MTKIFITGASGYIGGQVLQTLAKAHPDYSLTLLIRDPAKANQILHDFPSLKILSGSLEDDAILEQAAAEADVVLHLAATGHLKSVEAIHRGLSRADRGRPAYWVQVSGASALATAEIASSTYGEASDKVFDDLEGIAELREHIKQWPNRAVDNYVLKVAEQSPHIRTALVIPGIIYGQGSGPGNQRSVQIPNLVRATLERGRGLQVGKGLSQWADVHVADVANVFVRLAAKAAEGVTDEQLWNQNGLYLTGVGEMPFAEISSEIVKVALFFNLIKSSDIDQLSAAEFDAIVPHGSVLYGTNARGKGQRAAALLGWKPSNESLEIEIPRAIVAEQAVISRKA